MKRPISGRFIGRWDSLFLLLHLGERFNRRWHDNGHIAVGNVHGSTTRSVDILPFSELVVAVIEPDILRCGRCCAVHDLILIAGHAAASLGAEGFESNASIAHADIHVARWVARRS